MALLDEPHSQQHHSRLLLTCPSRTEETETEARKTERSLEIKPEPDGVNSRAPLGQAKSYLRLQNGRGVGD